MKSTLCALLTTLMLAPLLANADPFKQVGDYKIHYSAFNTRFIQPDIAATYDIVRGKNRGLVNIVVVPNDDAYGVTAHVEGTVSNIFAQQRALEFVEVREGDAVYYLAPFKHEKEDPLTFKIKVRVSPDAPIEEITFQRTFHQDP